MALVIDSVVPSTASASGGEIVRVTARGLASGVDVRIGDARAEIVSIRPDSDTSFIDLRTPRAVPGETRLTVTNVHAGGTVGETVSVPFRVQRAAIARESDLTRLVRTLLRLLKEQVLANTSTPVSLDYREGTSPAIPIARVPSLTVFGPDVRENRLYGSGELVERVIATPAGLEIETVRPPTTVDLRFVLEAVTNATAEHLELFNALVTFFHRNPYLEIARDGDAPGGERVRFVLAADGDARAAVLQSEDGRAGRADDRRAFEWALVIRGFPVDELIAVERARPLASGVDVRVRRADVGS